MIDERGYVIAAFQKNFISYKNENIVIYGLGKNTKVLLDTFPDYRIVGLMDGIKTGEVVWGLPVITCAQAHAMNVKAVIILARSSNVSIIYRRIAAETAACGIPVYDINGVLLHSRQDPLQLPEEYQRITEENLKRAIDSCEVVSFDIFDTLLVRSTLYPTDVFEEVAEKFAVQLPAGYDFVKNRISAERMLYETKHPDLADIYCEMQKCGPLSQKLARGLMEAEIEAEFRVLCAREPMRDIVSYAIHQGKEVCYTSDMYLPEDVLRRLLAKNGFIQPTRLFVSCAHQASKSSGLFDVVKDSFPSRHILHIGDNRDADIKMAERYGINRTFELPSAYRMLEDSPLQCMLNHTNVLPDRNTIGCFISRQFNSPFLFAKTGGKCSIASCYELGYYFLEPILAAYVTWVTAQAHENSIELLLLGARDGWLVAKLCSILAENGMLDIPFRYFYTSRSACSLAGMKTADDALHAASLAFSGTTEELLKKRFFLSGEEIKTRRGGETDEEYFERHIPIILQNACSYRENYLAYCRTLPIQESRNIGFTDFVSSGTCQLWLEKILNKPLTGYYFVRLYGERREMLNIQSLFAPKCVYEQQSRIFDNYLFLENVLTSPEPTLKYFCSGGKCVFEQESRSGEDLKNLSQLHTGILDAFRDRISQGRGIPSAELSDQIVNFIRKEYSEISIPYFKGNVLKDEFCNREFELEGIMRS